MRSPAPDVPPSAVALLTGAVDYAGLFPPAALPLDRAVAEYAAALDGTDAWMLGRFVVPAARLPELAAERAGLGTGSPAWKVSAIVAADADADLANIMAFNASAAPGQATVDAVECRVTHVDGIDWLAGRADGLDAYVEIAATGDAGSWLDHIASRGLRAKIRLGGTTAEAFPAATAVVAFIAAAVRTGVPFKATAGLHHAVGGSYRLTYDDGAIQAPMFGYLNVLLATAALSEGLSTDVAVQVLTHGDASFLVFAEDGVRWGGVDFPNALLRRTRAQHLVAFGSCSFREPVDELRALVAASR